MNRTPRPDNPDLPPTGTPSTTNPGAVGLPPWLDESDPELTGRPWHDKPDVASSSRARLGGAGARPGDRPWCEGPEAGLSVGFGCEEVDALSSNRAGLGGAGAQPDSSWCEESGARPRGGHWHGGPGGASSSAARLGDPGTRPGDSAWVDESGAGLSGGPWRGASGSAADLEDSGAHPDDSPSLDETGAEPSGRPKREEPNAETNVSPRPNEPDVHLSVFLHGLRFDFAVCPSAATRFITEWRIRHHPGAAAILPTDPRGLPRLPTERLYLL